MVPTCRVAAMYRYPVKGLSPQATRHADLASGGFFPGDRLYAVENGSSGFDEAAPAHLPKAQFLSLMQCPALALIASRYNEPDRTLTLRRNGEAVHGDLATPAGRELIADFLARHLPAGDLRGPLRLLAAPDGFRFTDSRRGFVSVVNLASVAALEDWVSGPVDPLRLRANLYVEGWPAFAELDLVGRTLAFASGARLKVIKRIQRCTGADVDPRTGRRDLHIPRTLMVQLDHADCGIYCEVLTSGRIDEGERFMVEPAESPDPAAEPR
ncbi:MOSC domain-containing protein [Blastochloris viridis]|uniref:MOSC domain protein n=1 Tax=Blastochloris viridis TaxID=1079 RepID=A0A0H5BE37_BLAVI|nr:MOSC N-terminal beta barrel domain-containing protein [Blastochloris viridis]ALK08120.1 MOSC domain protein [Blastochloris viridis]BAR98616.1 MOSC domain protein [Blastochloris viridis]CUU44042.1 putative Fe-S protein [Blastochloris viridis]